MKLLVRIFTKVTMYTFLGYALFMIRLVGGGQTLLSLLLISFTMTALIYCCTVIESFLNKEKNPISDREPISGIVLNRFLKECIKSNQQRTKNG